MAENQRISSSRVFSVDYTDREAVIKLAKSFGLGMTVYKHPDQSNYSITHTSRTDLYDPKWVVFQT